MWVGNFSGISVVVKKRITSLTNKDDEKKEANSIDSAPEQSCKTNYSPGKLYSEELIIPKSKGPYLSWRLWKSLSSISAFMSSQQLSFSPQLTLPAPCRQPRSGLTNAGKQEKLCW